MDTINSAAQGQPSWINPWFHFWTGFLGHNPHMFAVLTAIIESIIAIALLFGIARRSAYVGAAIFSIFIWSVAEGFGGPYSRSSTDIGAAVMYAGVFFALYGLDRLAAPPQWSLDKYISKKIPWWSVIANP